MHDGAKGSFWDRIRFRFKKIMMKLKKLRKKKKLKNPFDEERLLKKKREEELYNYYRMNSKNKTINKPQTKVQSKKIGIEINNKKDNKNIQKDTKSKDMSINNTKIVITPTSLKKKTITVNDMNNIINQTKNRTSKKYNNDVSNEKISSKGVNNTNSNKIKNKNIVTVKQNIEPFKKFGRTSKEKFSLKRKNKFNTITYNEHKKPKKTMGIVPAITNIVNKVNPKKIKEQKEIKKAFSIKEIDLSKFNKVNSELDKKLEKQKEIGEKLNKLVKEIEPKKQIEVKYHFINNIFSNLKNLFLSVMSIPLLRKPNNIPLFSVGLFMFNNAIRNMRKMVTKDEYIRFLPSDAYTDAIKENINNFELIDYMIDDSLNQISSLKHEYSHEFSEYSETRQFRETIQKLNNYETTLKEKQKKVLKEKEKMNIVLDKNCKKLQLIKDMNK